MSKAMQIVDSTFGGDYARKLAARGLPVGDIRTRLFSCLKKRGFKVLGSDREVFSDPNSVVFSVHFQVAGRPDSVPRFETVSRKLCSAVEREFGKDLVQIPYLDQDGADFDAHIIVDMP